AGAVTGQDPEAPVNGDKRLGGLLGVAKVAHGRVTRARQRALVARRSALLVSLVDDGQIRARRDADQAFLVAHRLVAAAHQTGLRRAQAVAHHDVRQADLEPVLQVAGEHRPAVAKDHQALQ
ncbi:MAG: hypothetical protein ACK559_36040, partial [bacterium]